MTDAEDRVLSREEVAAHNKDGDLWIIVDDKVYDLSKFQDEHPGGKKILLGVAGKDASKKYRKYHGDAVLRRHETLRIGTIAGDDKPASRSKGLFGLFRSKS
ncbi:hypothetical protein VTO42DRAFT_1713 [Malbranchea cinnamomea]